MKLDHLNYFIATAECGTLSKAAGLLNVSPQAISQAIKQLESEYSAKLFFRANGRIVLSALGKSVYDSAKAIIGEYSNLLTELSLYTASRTSSVNESLNIYAGHVINCSYLPTAVSKFHKMHPSIRLQVTETVGSEIIDTLSDGGDSIRLFCIPYPSYLIQQKLGNSEKIEALFKCSNRLLMSKRSPFAGMDTLYVDTVKTAPFIILNTPELSILSNFYGIDEPNILMRSYNMNMCRTMLSIDDYALGLTNSVIDKYMPSDMLVSKPLCPELELVFGYSFTGTAAKQNHYLMFLETIRQELTGG